MDDIRSVSDMEETLDQVDCLVWSYLDGEIDESSVETLDGLLASDAGARRQYIDATRLHCDLFTHFHGTPRVNLPR